MKHPALLFAVACFALCDTATGHSSRLRRGSGAEEKAGVHADEEPSNFGDLACMRWTGETCATLPCGSVSGSAKCSKSNCVCDAGSCADAHGVCVPETQVKWLGEHSVRFTNSSTPYLSVAKGSMQRNALIADANSEAQWRVAQIGGNFVRLESAVRPGLVLAMSVIDGVVSSDLKKFEDVSPSEASFQVRKFGKRLELYHLGYAISARHAGGNRTLIPCPTDRKQAGACQDTQLVAFDPELEEMGEDVEETVEEIPENVEESVEDTQKEAAKVDRTTWIVTGILFFSIAAALAIYSSPMLRNQLCPRGGICPCLRTRHN